MKPETNENAGNGVRGKESPMKLRQLKKRSRGQTIIEYVLIICIVVVAAVGILGVFSDTVRQKIAGVVNVFGGDTSSQDVSEGSSENIMRTLDEDGSFSN